MHPRPTPSLIALLTRSRPLWAPTRPTEVIWCTSASELAVLARAGRLRAAVIDSLLAGLDAELIGLVRRSCTVLVVGGNARTASRWEAAGTSVLPVLPSDESSLLAAVAAAESAAESAAQTWVPPRRPPDRRAALVVVLPAPGGHGIATAISVARSLVSTGRGADPIVLADLTLDAPHRNLHGLTPDHPGLPDLIEAGRFGPPLPGCASARHPTRQGYLVVPGLLRHQDWVIVGDQAAASALEAIRVGAELVVAHVDRDLEGETDTGSFDIEDRNVLARTAVQAADLVVVAAGADRPGRLGVIGALGALARFGVPHGRTLVVRPGSRWGWLRTGRDLHPSAQVVSRRAGDRPDPRLGTSLRTRLSSARALPEPHGAAGTGPQPIVPGTLGHWGQDIDGWITPRVPQQP